MKYYPNYRSILFFLASLLFILTSCTDDKDIDETPVYEELMKSMKSSWELNSVFSFNTVEVHDFSKTGILKTFILDDGLFFILPGDTCNSCLEREFQKFLDWETDLDKFIISFEANNNYLKDLKTDNPEIKGVFVIENESEFRGKISLPYIIYYNQKSDIYLNYSAVKSEINHLDYFQDIINSMTK